MDVGSSRAQVIPEAAQGLHVLLVDNDTNCLTHIATVLEEQSYQVTTTKHASIALSLIRVRERLYDLVIAELNMPEMDGFAFIKQVLLIKEDIPIILISSTEDVNIAKKALNEGACFFLSKPIRSQDLADVWQHVFRNRCKRRSYSNVVENQDAQIVPMEKPCDVSHDIEQRINGDENLKGKGKGPCLDEGDEGQKGENKDEEKVAKNKGVIIQENNGKGGGHKNGGKRRHKKKGRAKEFEENVKTRKRQRFVWPTELHDRFVQAIARLGEDKAQPKILMREMDVPGLSRRRIASHLQKYRVQSRKIKKDFPQNPPPFQSKGIQEPTSLPSSMMNTKLDLPHFQSMMPKPTQNSFSSHTPSAKYAQPQTIYESMMMSKPMQHFSSSYTLSAKYEQPKTIFESLKMSKPAQNFYSIHTPNAGSAQPQITLNADNAYYNLDTLKRILGPNKLPKTGNDQNVQENLGNQEFHKSNHMQNATADKKGKQVVSSFEGYEANANDATADNLGICNIDALLESWKNELAKVLGSDPILHQDISALAIHNVVAQKSQEPSKVVHTACKELEASKEIPIACEESAPSKEISKAREKLASDNREFNTGKKDFYQDLAKFGRT